MHNQLINQAKKQAKEIHQQSKQILEDHNLIFYESTLGYDITQVWDGWIPYIEGINFGSRPLTLKQVKSKIEETEYLNFL
jgi:hypothetical protein